MTHWGEIQYVKQQDFSNLFFMWFKMFHWHLVWSYPKCWISIQLAAQFWMLCVVNSCNFYSVMAYDNFTNSFLFAKNQEKEAMLKALPPPTDWWPDTGPSRAGGLQENMPLKACNTFCKLFLLLLGTFNPKYPSRLDNSALLQLFYHLQCLRYDQDK